MPKFYIPSIVRLCMASCLALLLFSCSDSGTNSPILDPFFAVDRVVPRAAPPGSFVTIYGKNLYHDTTKFHVLVAGVPAKINSINPFEIIITVPENARGRDIALISEGENWVVGTEVRTPFQVIDSPYPFRGYEVSITGVTGITAYNYYSDEGYTNSSVDTSELDIHQRQIDFTGPDGNFCDQYTNGDTIRICSNTGRSGSTGYDRFTLVAVVDSIRGVITRLELNQSFSSGEYTSPSDNTISTGGTRMIFRNIPYTRMSDGSLQVDVTGSHIFDYISVYESSRATSQIDDKGWGHTSEAVRRLIGASADARFKVWLFRYP